MKTTEQLVAENIVEQARFMRAEHGLALQEGIHSTFQAWAEGEDDTAMVARVQAALPAAVKSPERTMRWMRVCAFIERELHRIPREDFGARREILEFVAEEHTKAAEEGFDDTATYLQHIINDLS